jgi:hypothetical protein
MKIGAQLSLDPSIYTDPLLSDYIATANSTVSVAPQNSNTLPKIAAHDGDDSDDTEGSNSARIDVSSKIALVAVLALLALVVSGIIAWSVYKRCPKKPVPAGLPPAGPQHEAARKA